MSPSNKQQVSSETVSLVAERLTVSEGKAFKFFGFLNLSRFSLVFVSEDGDQKVLTVDSVQRILKGQYENH